MPMNLIGKRIPKEMFEKIYKMDLPDNPTATEVMQIYSGYQGYVTGNGLPDENKAARIMLKDYNNGKLLYVHLRPDYDRETHGYVNQSNVEFTLKEVIEETVEETKEEVSNHLAPVNNVSPDYVHVPMSVLKSGLNGHKEDKFDKRFFEEKKEKKLTKAQKRALKFAVKRGQDPDKVDLENLVLCKFNNSKTMILNILQFTNLLNIAKVGQLRSVSGYSEIKKHGINSNKVTHFSDLNVD
jgi:large subunit GTPase 1